MPKQTKPKAKPKQKTPMLVKPKVSPPTPVLPKEEQPLLLPAPHKPLWPFILFVAVAIVLVLSYAINPWFSISAGAAKVLMIVVMGIFLVGLIALFVVLVKLFADIWRARTAAVEKDKHAIVLLLVLLLSIVVFSSVVYVLVL